MCKPDSAPKDKRQRWLSCTETYLWRANPKFPRASKSGDIPWQKMNFFADTDSISVLDSKKIEDQKMIVGKGWSTAGNAKLGKQLSMHVLRVQRTRHVFAGFSSYIYFAKQQLKVENISVQFLFDLQAILGSLEVVEPPKEHK